ncbi:juvenile hormone epoxide hydrolase 1-like [Eurosta solidaginis]|uniref:juvenile hormone epoxide hydrolase 1-like n=1 Tax=Eurosta solidaginis TaxID=178769 RepID=UPI0035308400
MKLILFVAVSACFVAYCCHKVSNLIKPSPKPNLDTNLYWGPGDGLNYKAPEEIVPFKIIYDKEIIDDLRTQLNRTWKYAKPLKNVQFQYGFNSEALQHIVTYWRDFYLPKWSERQEYLNSLPQFKTEIQGLKIHYIHAKPSAKSRKDKKVLPLLLLHGWPGSVREFYDFINLLIEPSGISNYVFEVIAPSLVGFGWSDAATRTGFNAAQMAIVMRNLMLRVGFDKFLVQGGDWGSIIGSDLATLFSENVLGLHCNLCLLYTPLAMAKEFIAGFNPERHVPSRLFVTHHFPMTEKFKMLLEESGYFHLQATKPDTIGIALEDNPTGLAAYILEKFQSTSGTGLAAHEFNAMDKAFTLDALLDNLMIYYLTSSATTAGRFYAEYLSNDYTNLKMSRVQSPVKMGCARFKNDMPSAINWALEDKFPNLVHSSYFNQGGHFAALEVPAILYTNFQEFVNKVKN